MIPFEPPKRARVGVALPAAHTALSCHVQTHVIPHRGASPTRRECIDRGDPGMLALLAAPLGLTAPRGHAAAAARVTPRAPALAALAAGSSSALSFEEWAAASGIRAPKLFIDDVQELRGATARAPLAAGEELCRVPRGRTLDLASVAPGESPCPELAPPQLWSSLAWCEPRTRRLGLELGLALALTRSHPKPDPHPNRNQVRAPGGVAARRARARGGERGERLHR